MKKNLKDIILGSVVLGGVAGLTYSLIKRNENKKVVEEANSQDTNKRVYYMVKTYNNDRKEEKEEAVR